MRYRPEIQSPGGQFELNRIYRFLICGPRRMVALVACAVIVPLLLMSSFGPTFAAPSVKGLIPGFKKEAKPDEPVVIFETDKGNFKLKIFKEDVPATAENFLALVENGFYDGLTFHRYERDFCVQGGDPTGTGTGGSKKHIPLEISPKLRHDKAGMVGMAHTSDPNSGASQFYVIFKPTSFLDDDYTVFAQVIDGMDNVIKLRQGDKMTKVYLEEKK